MRIPRDFELNGTEALLSKEGNRLVIEPVGQEPSLLELLSTLEPLTKNFPNVDESLGQLDEVELTLVTANKAEFKRVKGLKVENWLQ